MRLPCDRVSLEPRAPRPAAGYAHCSTFLNPPVSPWDASSFVCATDSLARTAVATTEFARAEGYGSIFLPFVLLQPVRCAECFRRDYCLLFVPLIPANDVPGSTTRASHHPPNDHRAAWASPGAPPPRFTQASDSQNGSATWRFCATFWLLPCSSVVARLHSPSGGGLLCAASLAGCSSPCFSQLTFLPNTQPVHRAVRVPRVAVRPREVRALREVQRRLAFVGKLHFLQLRFLGECRGKLAFLQQFRLHRRRRSLRLILGSSPSRGSGSRAPSSAPSGSRASSRSNARGSNSRGSNIKSVTDLRNRGVNEPAKKPVQRLADTPGQKVGQKTEPRPSRRQERITDPSRSSGSIHRARAKIARLSRHAGAGIVRVTCPAGEVASGSACVPVFQP